LIRGAQSRYPDNGAAPHPPAPPSIRHEEELQAMESATSPLEGIRVVDLSRVLAGPYCTLLLSMLGARVIKIEDKAGDESRAWPPMVGDSGATYQAINLNKRSIVVDLKTPEGQEIVRDLARRADVLVENFKSGTMERFELDYPALQALNPRLVYASITAFGGKGPRAANPGYEALMQAYNGVMSMTGEPEGAPVRCGVSYHDMSTGITTALAIVTALFRRASTGLGGKVDASLLQTSLGLMAIQVTNFFQGGLVPRRLGSAHPMVVPYQVFPTKDKPLMVASANQNLFARLCKTLDLEWMLGDPRFKDNPSRVINREACIRTIEEKLSRYTRDDVVQRLLDAGVPCAPVNDLKELMAEEQVHAIDTLIEVQDEQHGTLRFSGLPFHLDERGTPPLKRPPHLGEHTREVLGELGYDSARIASLFDKQVVAG
jgi:crotonobetainyl-CoA:carnitine CoA-transferase CaiB-like acyl-CoA transferase